MSIVILKSILRSSRFSRAFRPTGPPKFVSGVNSLSLARSGEPTSTFFSSSELEERGVNILEAVVVKRGTREVPPGHSSLSRFFSERLSEVFALMPGQKQSIFGGCTIDPAYIPGCRVSIGSQCELQGQHHSLAAPTERNCSKNLTDSA